MTYPRCQHDNLCDAQLRLEAGTPATQTTQRTPHATPYTDLQAS